MGNIEATIEKTTQTAREDATAADKPEGSTTINTMINSVVTAIPIGTALAASAVNGIPFDRAMNRKEITIFEGRLVISPPRRLPIFSAR
jgi:hypothetical protein